MEGRDEASKMPSWEASHVVEAWRGEWVESSGCK